MSVNADKEGKVVIKLNKSFYDIRSIRKGMEDFSALCSGTINDREQFEIILKGKGGPDAQILGHEFCNYVLALMKNKNIV